jgi:hypothetical protein
MAKRKERRSKPAPGASVREAPSSVVAAEGAERVVGGAPLLFCPFCREAFEGQAHCPDHDLTLVPWEELPRVESEELAEDDAVSPVDLRFGRGELLAGVVLLLVSVVCPLFTVSEGDSSRAFSVLAAATDRHPNLWTVPFVAALVLSITLRRRTIRQMLGARLAILILALGPFASVAYTLWRVSANAAELGAALHRTITVDVDWGVGPVLAGATLLAIGGLRLGVQKHERPERHDHAG